MLMLGGVLGIALLVLVPLHLFIWWIKSVHWLPNWVGTLLGCVLVIGISVALCLVPTMHTVFTAIALIGLGLPSLYFLRNFPATS